MCFNQPANPEDEIYYDTTTEEETPTEDNRRKMSDVNTWRMNQSDMKLVAIIGGGLVLIGAAYLVGKAIGGGKTAAPPAISLGDGRIYINGRPYVPMV